jgi:hypothetical protein
LSSQNYVSTSFCKMQDNFPVSNTCPYLSLRVKIVVQSTLCPHVSFRTYDFTVSTACVSQLRTHLFEVIRKLSFTQHFRQFLCLSSKSFSCNINFCLSVTHRFILLNTKLTSYCHLGQSLKVLVSLFTFFLFVHITCYYD